MLTSGPRVQGCTVPTPALTGAVQLLLSGSFPLCCVCLPGIWILQSGPCLQLFSLQPPIALTAAFQPRSSMCTSSSNHGDHKCTRSVSGQFHWAALAGSLAAFKGQRALLGTQGISLHVSCCFLMICPPNLVALHLVASFQLLR